MIQAIGLVVCLYTMARLAQVPLESWEWPPPFPKMVIMWISGAGVALIGILTIILLVMR